PVRQCRRSEVGQCAAGRQGNCDRQRVCRASAGCANRGVWPWLAPDQRARSGSDGDSVRNAMRRGERAQALYEFALVLPLFLLLMFGLIDFSRMLFSYVSIANGARELARSASVST